MVIGIAPHINSAFGRTCFVHIIAKTLDVRYCRFSGLICIRVDNCNCISVGSLKPCRFLMKRIIVLAESIIKGRRNNRRTRFLCLNIELQAVRTVPVSTLPFANDNILMSVRQFYCRDLRITGNRFYTAIRHCVIGGISDRHCRHDSKFNIPGRFSRRCCLRHSSHYCSFDRAALSKRIMVTRLRHCADGQKPEHQHKRHQR